MSEASQIIKLDSRVIIDTERMILPDYKFQCFQFNVITDVWLCGPAQNPRGDKIDPKTGKKEVLLRGAYPAGFLTRMKSAFYYFLKNCTRDDILIVCSGSVPRSEGMRLDHSDQFNPDFLCDAQDMKMIKDNTFKFTTSDTPYNEKRADTYYDTELLNKNKVLKEMIRVTKVGGLISVLDESFPQNQPKNVTNVARIAVTSVPNLTFRAFSVFRKDKE
jgi:hypothetical protein